MNFLTQISPEMEKMAEMTGSILAIVISVIALIGLLVFIVYTFMAEEKTQQERNKWIRSLDEHDKAVIMHYKSIKVNPWKRRKDK